MRVLVTGGAGFIGTNLVRRLLTEGHEPVVFDDFSTGLESNIAGLDIQVHRATLVDVAAVMRASEDCEAIVHLGARGSVPRSIADPVSTHEVNATGTLNVLEAARASGAYLVMSSSSSVYGANPLLPKIERTWTQPLSPYAASKLAGESYLLGYRESYGLEALALRLFNVYGPWQRPDHDYAAVIPKWIHGALQGRAIQIHGDGSQTRDFTYVDSVVEVLVQSVTRRVSLDGPINVAWGRQYTLLQLLEMIQDLTGRGVDREILPPRAGDVMHSLNDPALLRGTFPGVSPIELDDGLNRTVQWLKGHR